MSFDVNRALASAPAKIKHLNDHRSVDAVIVLGSGLGNGCENIFSERTSSAVSYNHFTGEDHTTDIDGHSNHLYLGRLKQKNHQTINLAIMGGRRHFYEGYSTHQVVFMLRSLILSGAKSVILCSAVGSTRENLNPGRIIPIRDHINLTGINPLIAFKEILALREYPQFPDQSEVYNQDLLLHLREDDGMARDSFVYGFMTGPSYETPSEVRALGILGADVVGMSMPLEATVANHMGVSVGGLCLVTNMAAGLGGKLSHQEVLEMTEKKRPEFHKLLHTKLTSLPRSFLK